MEPQIGVAMHKTCAFELVERTKDGGKIRISTAGHDRDKDRIFSRGGRVENYQKNPVVQYGHRTDEPWTTVGRSRSLGVADTVIDADFELRPAANEFDPQNIVLLLWNGGWIRTASIGFIPLAYKANKEGGYDITDWELLEWSLVPIPANQEALRLAVKSLDVTPIHPSRPEGAQLPALVDTPVSAVPGLVDLPKDSRRIGPEETKGLLSAPEVKEVAMDQQVEAVSNALYRALWDGVDYDGVRRGVVVIYQTYAIVRIGVAMYRVDYTIMAGLVVLAEQPWPAVEQAWIEPLADSVLAKSNRAWMIKAGARHSAKDTEAIQTIHDHALALGALCTPAEAPEKSKEVVPASPEHTDLDDLTEDDLVALGGALDGLKMALAR